MRGSRFAIPRAGFSWIFSRCARPRIGRPLLYNEAGWTYHPTGYVPSTHRCPFSLKYYPMKELSNSNSSPSSPKSIDSTAPEDPRALLRALLRECTYLPDPTARRWCKYLVLDGFERYRPKPKGVASTKQNPKELRKRVNRKLKEGKRRLRLLRRASQGERAVLLRVMLMAYGRTGRRRFEIMKPLRGSPADAGKKMPKENLKQREEAAAKTVESMLPPPVRALLASQIQAQPPILDGRNPRRIMPVIPAVNAWLKPMPLKRVRKFHLQHFKELMQRILPPLPRDEWTRLRRLATGQDPIPEPPQPRKRPAVGPRSSLGMVVRDGKASPDSFQNKEAHTLSPRFMRRLYAQVFTQCPVMDYNSETEEWELTWGHQSLNSEVLEDALANVDLVVDEEGKEDGDEEGDDRVT